MNEHSRSTLLLTRSDVAQMLSIEECIDAVESAFRLYAEGRTTGPGVLSLHVEGGGFHTKAAALPLARHYFAVKTNGNFFRNDRFGLPRIQGTIALCDAENGYPLALLDSMEITIQRTGAATAVAAKHLARRGATSLAIIGCGNQGQVSYRALKTIFDIRQVFAFDVDRAAAERFVQSVRERDSIAAETTSDVASAIAGADICVTCTPSKSPIVRLADLHPGLFIAAVGADSSEKQELDPALLRAAKVVVDQKEQAATIGDVHHAVAQGDSADALIYAELSAVIAGEMPGRVNDDEVIVFDSTGTALQDVAAAAIVYERALREGRGRTIDFAS